MSVKSNFFFKSCTSPGYRDSPEPRLCLSQPGIDYPVEECPLETSDSELEMEQYFLKGQLSDSVDRNLDDECSSRSSGTRTSVAIESQTRRGAGSSCSTSTASSSSHGRKEPPKEDSTVD